MLPVRVLGMEFTVVHSRTHIPRGLGGIRPGTPQNDADFRERTGKMSCPQAWQLEGVSPGGWDPSGQDAGSRGEGWGGALAPCPWGCSSWHWEAALVQFLELHLSFPPGCTWNAELGTEAGTWRKLYQEGCQGGV